jgi:hypothetical protein
VTEPRYVKRDGEWQNNGTKFVVMVGEKHGAFKINLGLFLAELICIPAFVIEMKRALDGNTLSWAYVFEWPLLGCYAVYMWRKLLQEERGEERRPAVTDEADPKLDEWNAYLASVHQNDSSPREKRDD